MREVKIRQVGFALKEVTDVGTFEGIAAVYSIRDELGDIILPGAFAHSLAYRQGKFPMFWQHRLDEPIGFVEVKDSEAGLLVKGLLNLEVNRGKETHALMRQALVQGHPFGLSFGYDTVKSAPGPVENGRMGRLLKEVKLWEISPTLMPAHPMAQVLSVKGDGPMEGKPFGDFEDFDACVAANQDKDDPEGFCAWLHQQITGEWPTEKAEHFGTMEECLAANQDREDPEDFCTSMMQELAKQREMVGLKARAAALFERRPNVRLTRKDVEQLCPSCAEKMAALNLRVLILGPQAMKQMPEQMLQGLCDKFGAEEGFYTRCVDGISGVDDPEAFCAWLHEQCTGLWPAEGSSKALAGARYALGEIERILRGQGATVAAQRAQELKQTVQILAEAASTGNRADVVAILEALSKMRQEAARRLTPA